MKVSIIIPCYNYGKFLHEAIESALNQTYTDIEIIVVNDGSTDNTSLVAQQYPVKLITQANLGIPSARNIGITASAGNYILPLDADDKIHSTFLENTVPVLESTPSVGIVYTHRQHFGFLDTIKYAEEFNIERMKEKCSINYCSLFRKEVWKRAGGYNVKMTGGYEDWDFWLSVVENKWRFKLVDKVLFYYRKHGRTLSEIAKENHESLVKILHANHPRLFL